MATVVGLLERAGGATLEEIMSTTSWQKHSVCGFVSTLGSKHGYNVVRARREADQARVYAIEKQRGFWTGGGRSPGAGCSRARAQ